MQYFYLRAQLQPSRSRSRVSLLSYVYVRKYVQKIKDTLFFLLPAKKHTKPTTARKSVSENN